MSKLRIGILSAADALNPRIWSGTTYFSCRALEQYGAETIHLGPYPGNPWLYESLKNKISRIITGKGTSHYHTKRLAKKFSSFFSKKLFKNSFDWLYAPAGSAETSLLDTDIPILGLSDINHVLAQDYISFQNLWKCSLQELVEIEVMALHKFRKITYPTQWAAKSTIQDLNIDAQKIFIAPFGANIEESDIPDFEKVVRTKKSEICRLLFLGVDWKRKGGAIALETLKTMLSMNIPAELIVCGCVPPSQCIHPAMKVIPFLDKNNVHQRTSLHELLTSSSFLLLPTRAEAYGIVFCEASAFGLPSISTNVGGVSGVVREGKNGHLLPPDADAIDYAKLIAEIWEDQQRYCALSLSSRKEYEQRLNWKVWAEIVFQNIHKV
ncbi:MAG TPA: glycosyltransferase family 4 protein [Candidatus Kapabacteria bacterium]|nr:glycosyltransferase family 4 protein [Ignavibacteria bacterium]HRE57068.1 glycosyltransferase family 4 protein [Candidatus Kapabacteria bacterium]